MQIDQYVRYAIHHTREPEDKCPWIEVTNGRINPDARNRSAYKELSLESTGTEVTVGNPDAAGF